MTTIDRLKALAATKPYRNHSVYAEGSCYYIYDNDCTLTIEGRNIEVRSELENTLHEGCVFYYNNIDDAYEMFCSISIEDEC